MYLRIFENGVFENNFNHQSLRVMVIKIKTDFRFTLNTLDSFMHYTQPQFLSHKLVSMY